MSQLSVLMSAYNEDHQILSSAVESILRQSFQDFDFIIIIDNPQNDGLIQMISRYAEQDARVKYSVNPVNLGLPGALNRGIDIISTQYIARMDADDIAKPDRLQKQIDYLKAHKEIRLLGTNITYMSSDGTVLHDRGHLPTASSKIRRVMKYGNVFNHPTLMGETELFKKYRYRELKYAQDYDFTCRVLEDGNQAAILDESLLLYRKAGAVSDQKRIRQIVVRYLVQKAYRKRVLHATDIVKQLEEQMRQVDEAGILRSFDVYDSAMEEIRSGNKLGGVVQLLSCLSKNKYIRNEILNLFAYAALKS